MGKTPLHTNSAFVVANCGKTRPGQSHRTTEESGRWIVWKFFVCPGVEETDTFFDPIKALMVDDLPTFGYPTRPIVSLDGGGSDGVAKSVQPINDP